MAGKNSVETASKTCWNVASYARLSREDQLEGTSDSICGQKSLIADWAERNGARIVASYEDDGYSGSTFERPGFEQMMADASRGLFDTIVVKDLSRFGRSYLDCGKLIERDLPQMGVRLYSIADSFDSMQRWDYNTALLLPMKNLINEMQVVTTSEKVRTSLAAKRTRGECVANFAPYGYRKDPGDHHRLVVDEDAAQVVRRIFHMRAAGTSASAIARALNGERVPSPAAHKAQIGSAYQTPFGGAGAPLWHANTVMRILRNETYIGSLVQGKTRRPSWRMHVGFPVASDEWVRVPRMHQAIVDDELFREVKKLCAPLPTGSESKQAVPIMVPLYCGSCGAPIRKVCKRSCGNTYSYYICGARKRNSRACDARYLKAASIDRQIEQLASQDLADEHGNLKAGTRLVIVDGLVTIQKE